MKVAMVGQKGIPTIQGGIERHVEHLSVELVKKYGIDIVVYTRPHYTPKTLTEFKGVRLVSLPSVASKHLDAGTHTLLAVLHALYIEKVDIIHFHAIGPSFFSFLPRILSPRTRVVSTFHSLDMEHGKWGRFARFMLRLGARFSCVFPHKTIAVSMKIRDYCKKAFGAETEYLPYGVEIEDVYQTRPEDAKCILKQFHLETKKYVVVVSRLVRHKGVHTIIEAFQRLKNLQPDVLSGYKLVIIGEGAFTDSYTKVLRNLIADDDSVLMLGQQSGETLSVLFQNACLYVSGSESEGLSLASLEAMGYSLPIMVSDIPENLELFYPEERDIPGFVFQNRNVESMIETLREIMMNQTIAFEKGKRARKLIERFHSIQENARKVYDLYRGLIHIG